MGRKIAKGIPRRLTRVAKEKLRRARRPLRRRSTAHGLILMYHRVAVDSSDSGGICVSPQRFREQLDVLTRTADVVPLGELRSRLKAGRKQRPPAAITFDDGYADNLHQALPILERADMPATVFVSTSWIGANTPFWWDVLAAAVRDPEALPRRLQLNIAGEAFEWAAKASSGEPAALAERRMLYIALWRRLQAADESSRNGALRELADCLRAPIVMDAEARPLTVEELRLLANSPLVEIGGHTMSHCPLPKRSAEEQFREIAGSRERCAEITGRVPSSFAYPYGEYDAATPAIVASAGYVRACSTEQDLVWETGDLFLMPRFHVCNWDGDTFQRRLSGEWLP